MKYPNLSWEHDFIRLNHHLIFTCYNAGIAKVEKDFWEVVWQAE
jgi:hypothetical protein